MSLQKTMDNLNKEKVDWREGKTLPNCMLYMLEHEIMCDVTFRVGESRKTIKAHKNILASRSLIFHTMFEGSLPEKEEINIPDIDVDTFNNLLRYAYIDDVQISTNNVNRMLYAADKYMLSTIKTKCCELLKSTAQSSNAVVTLSTANQFHLEDLQKESLQYIKDNTEECLLSSHAVQLNSECVQMIVTSEYLSCFETEVCKFFLKWTEAQCKLQGKEVNAENLRAIAGGLMPFIKFPLVTDISEKIIYSEVLDMQSNTSHNKTIALKLAKQIRLNTNERYTIMVRDIIPLTYYGSNCKSVCNEDGITIIFENSPKCQCSTDVNHGQITEIMFSI